MTPTIGDPRIVLPQQIKRDAVIFVRAMLAHPMYTGMSRDHDGKLIPEYFVKKVAVTYGGEEIAHFEWTSGVSADPYIEFPVRATREAPLAIAWTDSKGHVYRQSANVAFSA